MAEGLLHAEPGSYDKGYNLHSEQAHDVLTYLLLENKGNGRDSPKFVHAIEGLPYGEVAIGSHLDHTAGELVEGMEGEELTDLNMHVRYVHTKFMLIDPLGES